MQISNSKSIEEDYVVSNFCSFRSRFQLLIVLCLLPLHHFSRPLIHAHHVAFLRDGVQEGILPKLHFVPQG